MTRPATRQHLLLLMRLGWITILVITLDLFVPGVQANFRTIRKGGYSLSVEKTEAGEIVLRIAESTFLKWSGVLDGDVLLAVDGVEFNAGTEQRTALKMLQEAPDSFAVSVRSGDGLLCQRCHAGAISAGNMGGPLSHCDRSFHIFDGSAVQSHPQAHPG